MNFKDLEKEFDEKFSWQWKWSNMPTSLKIFWKAKINSVINDMIGEEKTQCDCDDPKRELYKEWCGCKTKDYNKKVQELKKYKVKFNK